MATESEIVKTLAVITENSNFDEDTRDLITFELAFESAKQGNNVICIMNTNDTYDTILNVPRFNNHPEILERIHIRYFSDEKDIQEWCNKIFQLQLAPQMIFVHPLRSTSTDKMLHHNICVSLINAAKISSAVRKKNVDICFVFHGLDTLCEPTLSLFDVNWLISSANREVYFRRHKKLHSVPQRCRRVSITLKDLYMGQVDIKGIKSMLWPK